MPKDHVNLPERTERRRLLREFENAKEGKDIEGFEAYARALQALNEKLETMQKDFDALAAKGLDFSASEYRYHQQRLANAVKDLETKNQAYQECKMKQRNANDPRSIKAKNDYERDRIDYSLKVGSFLEDAKRRLPPSIDGPLTAEEKAYFQSAAERSRLIRQKDFLDGQKAQEPQEPQQGPAAVPGL